MRHLKFLLSKHIGSAMVAAAFLCVAMSGCADLEPTGPGVRQPASPRLSSAARADDVPFNKFFQAWSQSYSSGPIQTQMFALDTRQDRQYADLWADQRVQDFARANPGRLYIVGDEPDQWCIPASEYAAIYQAFVATVRGVDPTARVSPAGFAEPNARCCPPEDEACKANMHYIGYAEQFYNAYVQRFGTAPPVDEWRFHDFGIAFASGDLNGWWARVDAAAAWSVAHGANMVLGGWAFHGWREPVPEHQENLKRAMGRLMHDDRINGAVYWSYENWIESPRPLVYSDGSLTPEGQTYANPLTDVPAGVTMVDAAGGHAKLQWSNTTSAWGAEIEYWVQVAGSGSFVYGRTEHLASPGATEGSRAFFYKGDIVKARVRYYNVYGQADWSPFSNAVLIESGKQRTSRKKPLSCFMAKRIQGQSCA